jgi:hypothetical protein
MAPDPSLAVRLDLPVGIARALAWRGVAPSGEQRGSGTRRVGQGICSIGRRPLVDGKRYDVRSTGLRFAHAPSFASAAICSSSADSWPTPLTSFGKGSIAMRLVGGASFTLQAMVWSFRVRPWCSCWARAMPCRRVVRQARHRVARLPRRRGWGRAGAPPDRSHLRGRARRQGSSGEGSRFPWAQQGRAVRTLLRYCRTGGRSLRLTGAGGL